MREDLALLLDLLGTEPPVGELSGAELREAVRAAEVELARCLRAGELDESLDRVASAWPSTCAELDVARPGYADERSGCVRWRCLRANATVLSDAPPSIAIASPVM